MSEVQKAKIVSCFNITGRGIIAEIQHNLNGLPPDTTLKDFNSDNFWIVKERVIHSGYLLEQEVRFDCETKVQLSFVNHRLMNEVEEKRFREENKKKINDKIYWYYLTPNIKDNKPAVGQELLVELNQL